MEQETEKPSKKTVAITRRIQLNVDALEKEERHNHWQTLYKWQNFTYQAANMIMSHLFLQENIKDTLYLEEDVQYKLANRYKKDPGTKELVVNEPNGLLNTSRQNSTYRLISKKVKGEVPMSIMTCLNASLTSLYNKFSLKLKHGQISLPNFKKEMPIPMEAKSMLNMQQCDEYGNYSFILHGVPFRTFFGKDRSGNKIIWERALKGEYKFSNSSIQIKDKKIFMLAVFQFERQDLKFSQDIVARASLSFEAPMTVMIGTTEIFIGDKDEYLHNRLSIRAQMRRCQRAAKYSRQNHGRTRRLQSIDRFHEKEKAYITTRMHKYSNNLIKMCIQNKCGTLVLTDQSKKEEEAKENPFVLSNWSYFQLKEKILYKAAKVGINVIVE